MEAWTHVIMRNAFYNQSRQSVNRGKVLQTSIEIHLEQLSRATAENYGERAFLRNDIEQAMYCLPEAVRLAFSKYVDGYKYHEIADASNVPIGTVKTRIHTARRLLKQRLSEYDNSSAIGKAS